MSDYSDNLKVKPELVWVDFESNGLHKDGPVWPLEVGVIVTDMAGNIAHSFQSVVLHRYISTKTIRQAHTNDFVNNMHITSNLWDALDEVLRRPYVDHIKYFPASLDEKIVNILDGLGVKPGEAPLVGSTINFDRQIMIEFFPLFNEFLHYRNIDISSIKELCRRLNPSVYAKRPEGDSNMKLHRPVSDIKDSIREYQFYKENFLFEE